MDRHIAVKQLRAELDKHGLATWGIRLTTDLTKPFLGLCSYKDTSIILNAHHIDTHPDEEIYDTILHEVAHALTPGQSHNEIWRQKAKELGCTNTTPCSHLSFNAEAIDAIRSGAQVELSFEEETVTYKNPKYTITRLQDKCFICKKTAIKISEFRVVLADSDDIVFIKLECGHTVTKRIPKGTPFHTLVSNPDRLDRCEFKKHEWKANQCMKCGEYRPFNFQVKGMQFIETSLAINKGAMCMDEMGLGKTIQALGVIKFHPEYTPTVYVVKSKLRFQWFKQILIWLGNSHVAQVIQSSSDIIIPGLKSYIISYDMLVPKIRKLKSGKTSESGFSLEKFKGKGIKCFVLDECQQIKNPDSTRTQQVRKLVADTFWDEPVKVIPLSGTPWKNRGSEFFCALNIIDPTRFWSFEGFRRTWVDYYFVGEKRKEGGIKNPEDFKRYISNIAIRRERKDPEVDVELPETNRTKLYIKMTDDEEKIYEDEVESFVKWYNEAVIGGEELNSINILAKMSRMRHLIGLAKVPTTVEFVTDFIEGTGGKIVVFTHHIDVAELIVDELKRSLDVPVLHFSGSISGLDVPKMQDAFNNTESCVMIASTLAGGEGLNLQTGHTCVFHERQWNPANEEQAEGRFVRIGAISKHVDSTYTQAEGSIDEHFDGIVEFKRLAFHAAMNKGEAPMWNPNDIIKELAEVIVRKHNKKKAKK